MEYGEIFRHKASLDEKRRNECIYLFGLQFGHAFSRDSVQSSWELGFFF